MYDVMLERKGYRADGSTYTLKAFATLPGLFAGQVAKTVVLALNVGVLLMVEGYPLVSQFESQAGQPATYRDRPIAS
jgi:hypothetical protein